MSSITISLPQTLKDFVEHEVSTQGFGNVSEYFRSLLREAQTRDAQRQLESKLVDGLGADSAPADSTFWSQLRAEAERLIAERPLPMTPWPAARRRHRLWRPSASRACATPARISSLRRPSLAWSVATSHLA